MKFQDINIINISTFLKSNEKKLLSQVFLSWQVSIWTCGPINVERALKNLDRVVKVVSCISYHFSFQFVELNFRRILVTSADKLKENTNKIDMRQSESSILIQFPMIVEKRQRTGEKSNLFCWIYILVTRIYTFSILRSYFSIIVDGAQFSDVRQFQIICLKSMI